MEDLLKVHPYDSGTFRFQVSRIKEVNIKTLINPDFGRDFLFITIL